METAGVDTQVFKPHSTFCKLLDGRPLDVSICFIIKQWSRLILLSAILQNDQTIDKGNFSILDITCSSIAALPV